MKVKSNKGISLIVLVITIVVLIILAGVAIANLSGRNSITDKAQEAKEKSDMAKENEELKIGEYEAKLGEATGGTSGGVLERAINKAINGDETEINAIMADGLEGWIIDYNRETNDAVQWFIYKGESCYLQAGPSGVGIVTTLSDNAQKVIRDINILKGLKGSSLKNYISNDEINIPNFSMQHIPLYIRTSNDQNVIDIEYYDFLTFDFDLYVDNLTDYTLQDIQQNG